LKTRYALVYTADDQPIPGSRELRNLPFNLIVASVSMSRIQ